MSDRHHHHGNGPAVAAATVGAVAAGITYLVGRNETTRALRALHDEVHATSERSEAQTQETRQVMGHNFMAAMSNFQNLADGLNNAITELRELKQDLFRPRAAPGGEEPPA